MNVALIGNPIAGSGNAKRQIDELVQSLERLGHQVHVYLTQKTGDAKRWAGELGPRIATIVVAGGDGTLNEVLNGVVDPTQTPIALMPLGTANVLARELSLPKRAEDVAHIVDRGTVRRLDMGLVSGRRFLLLVSAGFDAMVTERVHRSRKGSLGYRGYLFPALKVLSRYRPPELKVEVDGQGDVKGALVVVSNVRNYGGIFQVADRARCDSGQLDVCVFPRGTIPALVHYGLSALRGNVSTLTDVTYLTGSRIWIESKGPVAVEVDGDYFGTTPVVIDLKPACVQIVVPA